MIRRSPRVRSKAFRSAAAPALAAFTLLVLAYETIGFAAAHNLLADFHAFWCAGSAVVHGNDPYRSTSLSACEVKPAPWGLYSAPNGIVVPAPLPPYALTAFAVLAFVRYPIAACIWFALLAGAVFASIVLLDRTLGIGRTAAAWIFLLPAAVLWLPFGEATPLALLGALLAARGLQAERPILLSGGLALLALEPHLAAGAWICAGLCVPRARAHVIAAGAVLAVLSFAVHGGALAEYLGTVLPLHALAEVPRPAQYSATWLLGALGVSAPLALRAGAATYVLSLIAGIAVALRLRRRWNDASVLVLAPVAAAAIGGTFVHASQIALALPFAAAAAARERGRAPGASAAVACGTLAVPWLQGGSQETMLLAGIGVCAAIVLVLAQNRSLAVRSFAACAALAMLLIVSHRAERAVPHHPRTFPVRASQRGFASAAWGRYVWREQSDVTIADWLAKAPTWLALLTLGGAAILCAANEEPVTVVRVYEAPAAP